MTEQLFERKASRVGKIARIGMAGALLTLPAVAGTADAAQSPDLSPIYINLPDWDCKQDNSIGLKSRDTINYTRPDTSVTADSISVTYPVDPEVVDGEAIYQTVVYENPGLVSGQILRYASNIRDCAIPNDVQVLEVS